MGVKQNSAITSGKDRKVYAGRRGSQEALKDKWRPGVTSGSEGVEHTASLKLHNTILDVKGLIYEPLIGQLGAQRRQRVHCAIHQHQGVDVTATYAAQAHIVCKQRSLVLAHVTLQMC